MADPFDPDAVFREAQVRHRAGDVAAASLLYRALLQAYPDLPPVLDMFGLAAMQIGRFDEALAAYDRLAALDPAQPRVQGSRAMALLEMKRPAEALAAADRAVALGADDAMIHALRGGALRALMRPAEALAAFDCALQRRPDDAVALNNRGAALLDLERWEEALAAFDRVLARFPDMPEALCNSGKALIALKRFEAAVAALERALTLSPGFAVAHVERGIALMSLDLPEEALASFDRGIALAPDDAAAHFHRGNALTKSRRYDEAVAAFDRAIALRADYASAYNNRGEALTFLWHLDDALADFERATACQPNLFEAHNNRGNALAHLNRPDEALIALDRSIALNPDFYDPYWNKAQALLMRGDLAEGWKYYEWRWKGPQLRDSVVDYRRPLWLGEGDIAGKTLLLHAEQGFGDTFQFCRYIPMVCALGAKVVVLAPAAARPLLASLPADLTLVEPNQSLPAIDLHCPLMSLPLAFKTALETIPAEVPYLFADEGRRAMWRGRLGEKTKPRIGLCWAGREGYTADAQRSMKLAQLAPLLQMPFEFHALHKEFRACDAAALAASPQLKTHTDEFGDYADTAALIAELDLTISVDTSIVHVAGALGCSVWVMLPWTADWRWLMHRTDSPWYPSATLVRQNARGDWDGVVAEIVRRLEGCDFHGGAPA